MQTGTQAFLYSLCAYLYPFCHRWHISLCEWLTLNGCIGLVIAFLISPYGLPKLAVKLLAWFIVIRMLFKEKVYG